MINFFNNIFFISAALTVFIGTIYPLFTEIIYQKQEKDLEPVLQIHKSLSQNILNIQEN